MDYLLEALKRRELFSWLHLAPLTFWHALLLRDRFNFLGLVAPVPDALKQQLSQQPGALTQVLGESTNHPMKGFERDRELTPGSLETRQLRPEPCSETWTALASLGLTQVAADGVLAREPKSVGSPCLVPSCR